MSDKPEKLDRFDLRAEREVREMQERAEGEFRRLLSFAWRGSLNGLRGTEWQLNDRGDRILISDHRPPRDTLNDQHAYSSDLVLLRTSRAGQETGLASAAVQIRRDIGGEIVYNRTRIQELLVHSSFRKEGLGSAMLEQLEIHARRFGSTEIYGLFSPEGDVEQVRQFYRQHGYEFRQTPDGEQVYKALVTPGHVETPEADRTQQ